MVLSKTEFINKSLWELRCNLEKLLENSPPEMMEPFLFKTNLLISQWQDVYHEIHRSIYSHSTKGSDNRGGDLEKVKNLINFAQEALNEYGRTTEYRVYEYENWFAKEKAQRILLAWFPLALFLTGQIIYWREFAKLNANRKFAGR